VHFILITPITLPREAVVLAGRRESRVPADIQEDIGVAFAQYAKAGFKRIRVLLRGVVLDIFDDNRRIEEEDLLGRRSIHEADIHHETPRSVSIPFAVIVHGDVEVKVFVLRKKRPKKKKKREH
jgi:hypothetical protein